MNIKKKKILFNFENVSLFCIVICASVFDLITLIFIVALILVSYFNFGIESSFADNQNTDLNLEKHGINESRSSRLGGAIILFFIVLNILINEDTNLIINDFEQLTFYIIIIFFISFLGFADDVLNGISYVVKLYFLLFSIIILIITNNEFLINKSGVFFLDYFLSNYIISFFITFFIISGFINASNMSDGANGILSGIAFNFNLILFLYTNEIIFFIFFKFLLIFFLYNILISNVFLGDTGSYFLGFLISTTSLFFYNQNIISAGFFACILSYPCLEIIFSISRRLRLKQNPFKPDNKHLHNLIFIYLKNLFPTLKYTNSLTGLLVNLLFVLPSLLFYIYSDQLINIYYWYIFMIHVLIYILIYSFTSSKNNEHIVLK